MKHLKIYENFSFDIGDYVHLKDDEWMFFQDVKIIDKNSEKNKPDALDNIFKKIKMENDYYVEALMKKDNKIVKLWIDLSDIERKSTPEEIEKYKLREDTNKYNI